MLSKIFSQALNRSIGEVPILFSRKVDESNMNNLPDGIHHLVTRGFPSHHEAILAVSGNKAKVLHLVPGANNLKPEDLKDYLKSGKPSWLIREVYPENSNFLEVQNRFAKVSNSSMKWSLSGSVCENPVNEVFTGRNYSHSKLIAAALLGGLSLYQLKKLMDR